MKKKINLWLEESKLFWVLVLGFLIFLSVDFWHWGLDIQIFGFFPIWIARLIVLQVALFITFLVFSNKFWRSAE